ncbi:hypothetical protein N8D74_06620 [Curtobacterium flaccumfaciens]|uniref:Uncharacterized protein n=1 Tax=Curtobacterium poinsettiae TaxID=159612 RepID=A0A9Q9P8Y4_9MICO|nr:hypothetical protein [Curtobacterium flaccumfaciens]UXN26548.1 hypothetical protein N8D74_06620 [Curtobacterium flaccumfaciens]UYC81390.1 hypothetical protein OE229_02705 [Curtobacterium flaccumfaciens pv. poinsettiae]
MVAASGEVGDEVVACIAGYRPARQIRTWALIADFVRHVVLTISPETPGIAQRYLALVAAFVNWCVLIDGSAPDDALLTDARVRAFFKEWAKTRSATWVAASRLRFDDIMQRYHDRNDLAARTGGPHAPRPSPPYTESEVARIFSWARSRSHPQTRRKATAISVLGFGFGLRAVDMVSTTRASLIDHGVDGISISLPDRLIWCDLAYEEDLRELVLQYREDETFLPYPTARDITVFLTNIRSRARAGVLIPTVNRMRATWFCRRASHFPALTEIMRSYGIAHGAALEPLIPFLPTVTASEAQHVLRTTTHERTS